MNPHPIFAIQQANLNTTIKWIVPIALVNIKEIRLLSQRIFNTLPSLEIGKLMCLFLWFPLISIDFYDQKNIPKPKPILPSLHLSHGTSVFRASSRSSPRAKRWPNCESANSWMAACVHTWPWSKSANHSRKKHGASVVPSCFFGVFFLVFWGCLFQG